MYILEYIFIEKSKKTHKSCVFLQHTKYDIAFYVIWQYVWSHVHYPYGKNRGAAHFAAHGLHVGNGVGCRGLPMGI